MITSKDYLSLYIKAHCGLPAQAAEEHPQSIVTAEVCDRIRCCMTEHHTADRLVQELVSVFHGYERSTRENQTEAAMDCMELASALALSAYGRELRHMGEHRSPEELVDELRSRILPHQNRSNLKSRRVELAEQMQGVLRKVSAPGVLGNAEKQDLANKWLELAVSFAKVPVKYEAELLKQQRKQERMVEQSAMTMTMTM